MSIFAEDKTIHIDVDGYARSTYVDSVSATKVSKSADNMAGRLDMSGYKITGVAEPLSNQDTATKSYVDALANLKLNKAGDFMTGSLSMGNNRITDVANPTSAQDAVTKYYLEQLGIPKFVVTSGNTPNWINTNIILYMLPVGMVK